MLVDEETELWREAVVDALDAADIDSDLLTDVSTRESQAFAALLDRHMLTDADPEDPAFAGAVAAVAEAYAMSNPGIRVTEATEQVESIAGRVMEAKGTATDGGRIFRVQILKTGTSRNGNRYTESVIRTAAPKYEGAKAFDHHRTPAELQSSTLTGLVGHYRNVEATGDGLFGDLHLLPGSTHVAEALDATILNQAAGLPPLVGISHDVMADFTPGRQVGGRRVREATAIRSVQSADVVADPSAGGGAVRVVQGGTETTPTGAEHTQESNVPVNADDVLAALQSFTPAQLAAAGLQRASESTNYPTTTERVIEGRVVEGGLTKGSTLGRLVLRDKAEAAGLPVAVIESALPAHFGEGDVDHVISVQKAALASWERAGLAPRNTAVVTRESRDKKVEALDAFFDGDFSKGYTSFRAAWQDITGAQENFLAREDINRRILRESWGEGFNSTARTTESADTATWAQLLGDSVTRRMGREYNLPILSTWRQIVSDIQAVTDFRTQRIGRMGGYGTLPDVGQGAPYQPLTTPPDEEATYAITKRGGTEDLTLEAIANDDRRVVSRIPAKLGRAAAQTLYRFVWDMLISGNGITCTYDSTVLFHANHGNTDTSSALSNSTIAVGRRKMRDQAAYGDTVDILATQPRFLVVPNELEELAWQICRSAVAVPSSGSVSDMPNINSAQGLTPILVPYASDENDWFLVADPTLMPTLEIGFYQGREEPELFTQSDNSVGSMFNADKITWKIRHIYSGTALEHRGFYRGQG